MKMSIEQILRIVGGPVRYADANQYQQDASNTAQYHGKYLGDIAATDESYTNNGLAYLSSGLASETGEVCGIIKRAQSEARSLNEYEVAALLLECGDVLWYISEILRHHEIPLAATMLANVNKLHERHMDTLSLFQGAKNVGAERTNRYAPSSTLGSRHDSIGDRPTGKSSPRTSHGTDTSVRGSDASKESVSRRASRIAAAKKVRVVRQAKAKSRARV